MLKFFIFPQASQLLSSHDQMVINESEASLAGRLIKDIFSDGVVESVGDGDDESFGNNNNDVVPSPDSVPADIEPTSLPAPTPIPVIAGPTSSRNSLKVSPQTSRPWKKRKISYQDPIAVENVKCCDTSPKFSDNRAVNGFLTLIGALIEGIQNENLRINLMSGITEMVFNAKTMDMEKGEWCNQSRQENVSSHSYRNVLCWILHFFPKISSKFREIYYTKTEISSWCSPLKCNCVRQCQEIIKNFFDRKQHISNICRYIFNYIFAHILFFRDQLKNSLTFLWSIFNF